MQGEAEDQRRLRPAGRDLQRHAQQVLGHPTRTGTPYSYRTCPTKTG